MNRISFLTKKGFTLLELLIVIAILAIISTIGAGFYINYNKNIEINSVSKNIVSDLKQAQSRSMSGSGDFKWGIHFVNGSEDYYELFSTPTDYNSGLKVISSKYYLSNGINFSVPVPDSSIDVIFDKINGGTINSSIVLESSDLTKTISISSIGNITDELISCDSGSFVCGASCSYFGDIYPTVLIGEQCWFAENLRTVNYPNGNPIEKGPIPQSSAGWFNYSSKYYSCPPNISNNGEDCSASSDSNKLGMLYQWSTIMNGASAVPSGLGPQGICPSGWHIPTDDNTVSSGWGKLYSYVESLPLCSGASGICLKVGGSTGFNMPFSGGRNGSGNYVNRGIWFNIWSASDRATNKIWNRRLYYTNYPLARIDDLKPIAFSVRCLKN